jgi:hypothetical protein
VTTTECPRGLLISSTLRLCCSPFSLSTSPLPQSPREPSDASCLGRQTITAAQTASSSPASLHLLNRLESLSKLQFASLVRSLRFNAC